MSLGLAIAGIVGFAMAFMIGANSVTTTFAPSTSSGNVGVLRGALLSGIFGLLGAITFGQRVTVTIGAGLLEEQVVTQTMALSILSVAMFLAITGNVLSLPIPNAFMVVGGVLGAGIGVGASWNLSQVLEILLVWFSIPIVGIFVGFTLSKILRKFLSESSKYSRKTRITLIGLGSFAAYTAGANQVGLGVGPLIGIVDFSMWYLLLIGGIFICIGSWIVGPE